MVVFACNGCGESLRKNKVGAHLSGRCRSASVSCIDCSKDFWGNEFDKHTTCVSEAEKYSGKNYVPKANANKGQVKQDAWLSQVEMAIDKVQTNNNIRSILERLKHYSNIPRKEKPFKNFLRNSFAIWRDEVCNEVWDLLMAHAELPKPQPQQQKQNNNQNQKNNVNGSNSNHNNTDNKKLSKREKKELRQQQSHKAEKKDKVDGSETTETVNGENRKKKKKRKRDDDDEGDENDDGAKAKKMRTEDGEEGEETGENKSTPKPEKTKFRWQAVMLEAVQAKGEEMKIKKLRKKVLGEYVALGCTQKPEENLMAKFDKKLKCHPGLKIKNDRVKLAKT